MFALHVSVFIFVLCIHKEVFSAKLISSKQLSTDSKHFTWNFIFSGTPTDINFSDNKGTKDSNKPDKNGLTNDNGEKLVPLDIDVRFGDTDVQDTEESPCHLCSDGGGVYWREWNGVMPKDAIVGGYTSNQCGLQVPLYLAHAYIPVNQAGIQPAQLFNYSKELTTSFEGIHRTTKTVEVLCSRDSSQVVWMPVGSLASLNPDTDFVIAGFERDFNLFFGRAIYNNALIIGKYVIKNKVVYFPYNESEASANNFEVLCYRKRVVANNIKIVESS